MKTLFLVRHAKSSWKNATISDISRALNKRGYANANLMSLKIIEQGISPDLLITSPAIRAYSTALLFAQNFAYNPSKIAINTNLYESSLDSYLKVISELKDQSDVVFLFGHNPYISEIANFLYPELASELQTCEILSISRNTKHWKRFLHLPNSSVSVYKPPLEKKENY